MAQTGYYGINQPKVVIMPLSTEAGQILTVLAQANTGLKISQIEALLPHTIARRTLQRRLTELKKNHAIEVRGTKSSVEYYVTPTEFHLPLSEAAQQLKLQITLPLIK